MGEKNKFKKNEKIRKIHLKRKGERKRQNETR